MDAIAWARQIRKLMIQYLVKYNCVRGYALSTIRMLENNGSASTQESHEYDETYELSRIIPTISNLVKA